MSWDINKGSIPYIIIIVASISNAELLNKIDITLYTV